MCRGKKFSIFDCLASLYLVSFKYFIFPRLVTPFNKIWMRFGAILGKIISPIVMGFIYFFVVTPIGILLRLINKDILKLKNNNDNTYWIKKDNTNSSMNNQF